MTPDEAAEILEDREKLQALYDSMQVTDMAEALHISYWTLRHRLRKQGVRLRGKGRLPPHPERAHHYLEKGLTLPIYTTPQNTREFVRIRAWAAYLRIFRCPLDCPEQTGCARDRECVLAENMIAAGHLKEQYWEKPDAIKAFQRHVQRITQGG